VDRRTGFAKLVVEENNIFERQTKNIISGTDKQSAESKTYLSLDNMLKRPEKNQEEVAELFGYEPFSPNN